MTLNVAPHWRWTELVEPQYSTSVSYYTVFWGELNFRIVAHFLNGAGQNFDWRPSMQHLTGSQSLGSWPFTSDPQTHTELTLAPYSITTDPLHTTEQKLASLLVREDRNFSFSSTMNPIHYGGNPEVIYPQYRTSCWNRSPMKPFLLGLLFCPPSEGPGVKCHPGIHTGLWLLYTLTNSRSRSSTIKHWQNFYRLWTF